MRKLTVLLLAGLLTAGVADAKEPKQKPVSRKMGTQCVRFFEEVDAVCKVQHHRYNKNKRFLSCHDTDGNSYFIEAAPLKDA